MPRSRVSNQSIDLGLLFRYREVADMSMWLALREQLLAQVQNHHLPHHRPEHQLSNTASPHHHNIDPAIAGTGIMNPGAGDSGGDDGASDGRKGGKRELSTSKRAAQNRAAQVCRLYSVVVRSWEVVGKRCFWAKVFRGDKDSLLKDYYSARSDNERKGTSRPWRRK